MKEFLYTFDPSLTEEEKDQLILKLGGSPAITVNRTPIGFLRVVFDDKFTSSAFDKGVEIAREEAKIIKKREEALRIKAKEVCSELLSLL